MDKNDYENSIMPLCSVFNEKEHSADYGITFIEFIELCSLFFQSDF